MAGLLAAAGCASDPGPLPEPVLLSEEEQRSWQDRFLRLVQLEEGPAMGLEPEPLPETAAVWEGHRDYLLGVTDDVREQWNRLIAALDREELPAGEVRVRLELGPDGRVGEAWIVTNTTSEPILGYLCLDALLAPAPYPAWTPEMAEELPAGTPIDFVFRYF